jgi:hypothetical protein
MAKRKQAKQKSVATDIAPAPSPIVLASLQRRGDAEAINYHEPPSIAAEAPIEIMHRLNWAERDLAIRKRREAINTNGATP